MPYGFPGLVVSTLIRSMAPSRVFVFWPLLFGSPSLPPSPSPNRDCDPPKCQLAGFVVRERLAYYQQLPLACGIRLVRVV